MTEEISLYEAIKQMRNLTKEGKSFNFVHATFNLDSVSTNGIRQVKNAILRPAANDEDVAFADFKLFYVDKDLEFPDNQRNCWKILIMYFNDKKVIL